MGDPLGALRRFSSRRPAAREQCELCATPLEAAHSHVVNLETRRLICACRPCWLLFAPTGAGAGKMRAVPERYVRLDGLRLDWDRLQIPVRTAFFFQNSRQGKLVAFYPSPAGATESLLGLEDFAAENPVVGELEPDVEALLVHAPRGAPLECFRVPIDACYELVGHVRRTWQGFDGGEEAWRAIDGFFDALRARSEAA